MAEANCKTLVAGSEGRERECEGGRIVKREEMGGEKRGEQRREEERRGRCGEEGREE